MGLLTVEIKQAIDYFKQLEQVFKSEGYSDDEAIAAAINSIKTSAKLQVHEEFVVKLRDKLAEKDKELEESKKTIAKLRADVQHEKDNANQIYLEYMQYKTDQET